ncbi:MULTISPECIES: HNH endonuclease [Rhizobium]|uniref:HNH endonuclease n=1 Tax=Rhizobium phaseoli TaxID=396 RepID=A0A7X6F6Q7_9HYPH|nr:MULTISPECIES: HNH endonuclease [Rhizobium]MDE8761978.1 HNH endonuclease [Rhizobium sp. CBK13]NKF13532.1 HNH endonuclease [Rhizobium phaseoli]QPK10946.1 HNH endonuclease [Rhizobium phaseoli]
MKGIFDTKRDSGYDDEIAFRYHFPKPYRAVAETLVGGRIVYREPQRNGGRRAYVATARVVGIEQDPARLGHAYAVMAEYQEFDKPVPFVRDGRYWETSLLSVPNPSRVGAFLQGKSIRTIPQSDFAAIVRAGLAETLMPYNAIRLELDPQHVDGPTQELLNLPLEEQERRIDQILMNRKIREASFRRKVCDAYDSRCAITGLRIVNGGGKSEAQAAHIWAVADGGPDVVQNGIALSATVHWLFDRHLISLTDDYRILVSHNKVPSELRTLFAKQMDRIHLPADNRLWPHPAYVARHRERFSAV